MDAYPDPTPSDPSPKTFNHTVMIAGVRVGAVVDTGATRSLIGPQTYYINRKEFGLLRTPNRAEVGATGDTLRMAGETAPLTVKI